MTNAHHDHADELRVSQYELRLQTWENEGGRL
jgi:hypothetical protein